MAGELKEWVWVFMPWGPPRPILDSFKDVKVEKWHDYMDINTDRGYWRLDYKGGMYAPNT